MKNKDQILLESLYNKVIQEQMDDIEDDQMESEYELRTDLGDQETSIEDIEAKLENEEGSEGEKEEEEKEESPEVEGEAETAVEKEAEEKLPEDAPDEGLTDDQVDLFTKLIQQQN
jgi:tyrosyl-tRNA synthetase